MLLRKPPSCSVMQPRPESAAALPGDHSDQEEKQDCPSHNPGQHTQVDQHPGGPRGSPGGTGGSPRQGGEETAIRWGPGCYCRPPLPPCQRALGTTTATSWLPEGPNIQGGPKWVSGCSRRNGVYSCSIIISYCVIFQMNNGRPPFAHSVCHCAVTHATQEARRQH